jgi:hypothetical protein
LLKKGPYKKWYVSLFSLRIDDKGHLVRLEDVIELVERAFGEPA